LSIILVHGSVETSTEQKYIDGLMRSAAIGSEVLGQNGDLLTAVEKTINELEDNPLFNAGNGSVLNRDGYVEVDGSIMDGYSGEFAAVAAMKGIRYAISVAKKVLTETDHVVLAGEGATSFALSKGFTYENLISSEQLHSWELAKNIEGNGHKVNFSQYTGLVKQTDTVGCVVLSDYGRLAAGSSTGGSFYKLPGRVGDTPFIGGGIFASEVCAVVCTGRGEAFIKTLTAKYIDDKIRQGKTPEQVAKDAIQRLSRLTNETGGVIIVDQKGNYAAAHNCNRFPVVIAIDNKVGKLEPIFVG
jgi:beta-aspartyl-peptidase (threonine type)